MSSKTGGYTSFLATVGFYGELRVYPEFVSGGVVQNAPDDYDDLTVRDTTAGPPSADTRYGRDLTPGGVVVIGAAGAVTVIPAGGVGDYPMVDDSSLDTADRRLAAGYAYLARQGNDPGRGSLRLEGTAPVSGANRIRAGGVVVLTDVQLGLSSSRRRIAAIEKTFTDAPTLEDWRIEFGGARSASLARLMRKLTRSVLS